MKENLNVDIKFSLFMLSISLQMKKLIYQLICMNQWKMFNLHKNQAVKHWGSRTDREE